jgi:hypothetical protein
MIEEAAQPSISQSLTHFDTAHQRTKALASGALIPAELQLALVPKNSDKKHHFPHIPRAEFAMNSGVKVASQGKVYPICMP